MLCGFQMAAKCGIMDLWLHDYDIVSSFTVQANQLIIRAIWDALKKWGKINRLADGVRWMEGVGG